MVKVRIERVEDHEQHATHEQHRQSQMHRGPEKAHAVEKTEKERRVAERRKRAARVSDEEDEEHHHMHDVLAIIVGAQQRPDQQHCRAGRAHDARERRTERDDRRIHARRAVQIAAHADAARHRIERGQQHDERHVLFEHRVNERAERYAGAEHHAKRHQKQDGPGCRDLAEMVMPESRRDERKHSNRQQHAGKWRAPPCRQGCAIKRRGRRDLRPKRHYGDEHDARPHGMSLHVRTTITCTRYGPCAPSTMVCSISPVRDGPDTKLTARGSSPRSARIRSNASS